MTHEIQADYNQSFILPPHLEDWVPSNHPARFIRDFMKGIDLKELGFRESPGNEGRPHYSNDIKLKIWLYGYFHKIRSLRSLESACYNHMGLIWLTGQNYPDHNTLWMFWRDNKEGIKKLFKWVTLEARKKGLMGLVLQALDGTKIKADVCDRKSWHSMDLKRSLMELDKGVEEVVDMIESSVKHEEGCYSLPEDNNERIVEEFSRTLEELDDIGREHLSPTDKDARLMKNGKTREFCYNSQALVDSESNLILAEDVTNDESDNNMLVSMIEEGDKNVGKKGEETVADRGYYSPEQLVKSEERALNVLVNLGEQIIPPDDKKRFHKSNFAYDSKKDVFVCPLGKELKFERIKYNRQKKYKLRLYRCHHKRDCPESSRCSREKGGRSIEMGPHYEVLQRQIKKQKEPGNKEILARRKGIIEPVFGIIKEVMGFRRFTVRGLENVKTQWSLICTSYNLRKLYRLWTEEKLII